MPYVISTNIDGVKHYYAGYVSEWSPAAFRDSGPIWNRTITQYAKLDEPMADAAKKQLIEMGYTVEKELVFDKRRKGRK
jgi:hypothetical protein